MASLPKIKNFKTPRGVAKYPRLDKPDVYKGVAKYKMTVVFDPSTEAGKKFVDTIESMRVETHEAYLADLNERIESEKNGVKKGKLKKMLDEVSMGDSPIKPVFDDEGNETNMVEISCKMNASYKNENTGKVIKLKPKVVSVKGEELDAVKLRLGGGSEVKVAGTLGGYMVDSVKQTVVSLRLEAVKLYKLRQWGSGGGADFDDDDDEDDGDYDDLSDFAGTGEDAGDDDVAENSEVSVDAEEDPDF